MKKLAAIVITLCTFTLSCKVEDTIPPKEWRREVKPRLSATSEWQEWRPRPVVKGPRVACRQEIRTHAEALRVVESQPNCIDAAIDFLEELAKTSADAMSDVAAAYYVRASNEDRPADLVNAWAASEQAILAAPRSPAARFNRALIQEALGLTADAIATWNELANTDSSQWGSEARAHYQQLTIRKTDDALAQWPRHEKRLAAALQANDRATVEQVIERFPSAAQRYFEEELLPQCAAARTAENLAKTKLLASSLSKRFMGDPFDVEVVEAIERASPEQLKTLAQGHRDFREARQLQESFESGLAAKRFESASLLLAKGKSPFSLRADAGGGVFEVFEEVIDRSRERGYTKLLMFARIAYGHNLQRKGNYINALDHMDAALSDAIRTRDDESLANIQMRRNGTFRTMGHLDLALQAALDTIDHERSVAVRRQRHLLYGEIGATVLALGHPGLALRYQNLAVESFQQELATAPPHELIRLEGIRKNLAIALRERAKIKLALRPDRNDPFGAGYDLTESARLSKDGKPDDEASIVLEARIAEVEGQMLVLTNKTAAIAAFTRAFDLASVENRTFRASILAQRAKAHRLASHTEEAKKDLIAALAVLQEEEQNNLDQRQPGKDEDLWDPYFSRFADAYQTLINLQMDDGEHARAFQYAERARAFEPLNLILKNDEIPPAFRELASKNLTPADAQRHLPAGTFLIQYSVHENSTYAWILSNGAYAALTLNVGRGTIERWATLIQNTVASPDKSGLDPILTSAYNQLIALPLAAIEKMPGGGRMKRLVIVPDGAMHGLPIIALRDPDSRRFLIERVPIEFAGSTKLYIHSLEQNARLSSTTPVSVLAIGNPAFDSTLPFAKGMNPLPYAEVEATAIRDRYQPNSLLLINRDATVPEFFKHAREYTIVHVAAHAIVNARVPSQSLLLLAPSKQPRHNGVLTASELLTNLHLDRTKLVVLAACSSAGGRPVGLEGVAPLVRPLLGAGVPAVIGSLWDVKDDTSKDLMVSFYRGYRASNDAASALRDAQVEMLRTKPDLESIFAWAPFQVIGHTSPLGPRPSNGGTPLGIHSQNSLQRSDRIHSQ